MSSYTIELHDTASPTDPGLPRVSVGRGWRPGRPAGALALVSHDGRPYFSIAVYPGQEEFRCFCEALVWCSWAVIGHGQSLYFVDLATRQITAHWLDRSASGTEGSYFGQLHAGASYMLVATDSRLLRFDAADAPRWVSPELGVDGVRVHGVDAGIIAGDGEWNPPGGWEPFALDLRTGQLHEQH